MLAAACLIISLVRAHLSNDTSSNRLSCDGWTYNGRIDLVKGWGVVVYLKSNYTVTDKFSPTRKDVWKWLRLENG